MKRNDFFLLLLLLLGTLAAFLLRPAPSTLKAEWIQVTIDGKMYGTWELNTPQTISVSTPYGENVIRIQNGAAYVSKADCPGRDCMKLIPVSNTGDTIVCLPHKLIVEGKSKNGNGRIDTIAH